MLRNLLSRISTRKDQVNLRWARREREMSSERQKLLLKITLLFHKIQDEKRDIHLIQPIIMRISGKGVDRAHNNSPVNGILTSNTPNYRIIFPRSDYKEFSDTDISFSNETVQQSNYSINNNNRASNLAMSYQENIDQPLVINGSSPPVNSHVKFTSIRSSEKSFFSGVQSNFRKHSRTTSFIETPKIVELDVQSDLLKARKSILKVAEEGYTYSYNLNATDSADICFREAHMNNSSELEFREENEHFLPPIAPEIRRRSTIPSSRIYNSRINTQNIRMPSKMRSQTSDQLIINASQNKMTSKKSISVVSLTSDKSSTDLSTKSSITLPPINY